MPYQPASQPPGAGDHLYFTGDVDDDCVIAGEEVVTTVFPEGGGEPVTLVTHLPVAFAGLHLTDSYAGTVDLHASGTVGELELASADASIAQNDPNTVAQGDGGTLTVTTLFTWTGGTLNSGPVPGEVVLSGATGMADPTVAASDDACTVGLGSTFTLSKNGSGVGSTLEVLEGTYRLLHNAAGFVVGLGSTILLKAPVEGTVRPRPTPGKIEIDGENKTKTATTKGSLEVKEGGTAVVSAANRTQENKNSPAKLSFSSEGGVSELKNAGTVVLRDRAWVQFDHTAKDAEGQNTAGGFTQANPQSDPQNPKELLQIEAGCKITCANWAWVRISAGHLELTEKTEGGTVLAGQPNVVIQRQDDVTYALVLDENTKIRWGEDRTVPIRLDITGDFSWTGDVELFVDHTAFKNDLVEVDGRILVNNQPNPFGQPDPKLRVKWFDATSGNPVADQGLWTLVSSKFVNAPGVNPVLDPIENTPTFNHPPAIGNFTPTLSKNAAKNKIELTPD